MGNSSILILRHGQTEYTDIYPDLTKKGVEEVQLVGNALSPYIGAFDRVIALSSPAIRAIGTADIFLSSAGVDNIKLRTSKSIENLKIKDKDRFINYLRDNSTEIDGELWLTDSLLENDNDLAESRIDVEWRAYRFLYHYTNFLNRINSKDCSTLLVVFTHFEIGNNFLKAVYGEAVDYPILDWPIHAHVEPIILELNDQESGIYTIRARGRKVICKCNFKNKNFIYLSK